MLFQNAKNINLKVSVSPISDLWKIFQISLVYEFFGKKTKPSRDSVSEFWSSWASCSESDRIFAFLLLCIQEGRVDNLLVIMKKKGDMYIGEKLKENVMETKIARNPRYNSIIWSINSEISTSFVAGGD